MHPSLAPLVRSACAIAVARLDEKYLDMGGENEGGGLQVLQVHELAPSPHSFTTQKLVDVLDVICRAIRLHGGRDARRWCTFVSI